VPATSAPVGYATGSITPAVGEAREGSVDEDREHEILAGRPARGARTPHRCNGGTQARQSRVFRENLTSVKRHADFPRDLLCAGALSPV